MPHEVFAEMLQKPKAKVKGTGLNQTEMFISDLAGNDCVDLSFERRSLRAAGSASSIGSRMFAFVFVDNVILERHS